MKNKLTVFQALEFLTKQSLTFTVHAYEGERTGIRIDDENNNQVDFIETPDGIDWAK